MPSPLSVGDFITISILIKDVVSALDNGRGSAAEYQELCRELWSLDKALLEVAQLSENTSDVVQLNALQQSAGRATTQCKECIVAYLDNIKAFNRTLRDGGSGSRVRDAYGKIKWSLAQKDELVKFRSKIAAHSSAINMLLITASMQATNMNGKQVDEQLTNVDQRLETSSNQQLGLLGDIQKNVIESTRHAVAQSITLGRLEDTVKLLHNSNPELRTLMTEICRSTLQNYDLLVDLQTRIPKQTGPCWIQDPIIFTDAHGRVAPIHLELVNTWDIFEAVLAARFSGLPGRGKVERREYVLQERHLITDIERSKPFESCFMPGRIVDMSVSFKRRGTSNACPKCSLETTTAISTSTQCVGCGLWFQRIEEIIEPPQPVKSPVEDLSRTPQGRYAPSTLKRKAVEEDEDVKLFKRVRLLEWRYNNNKVGAQDLEESSRTKRNDRWAAEENILLIDFRNSGLNWEDISKRLPGRSARSCRLHYEEYLSVQAEVNGASKKPEKTTLHKRESLVGSLDCGMSWDGVSVGSWIRDEIVMADTEPFSYQSPGYHSSSNLPKLEAEFMHDFSCCGQNLPTLHDLLQHSEEVHAQQTPQSLRAASATAQPSLSSQHNEQPRPKRARLSSHLASPPKRARLSSHLTSPPNMQDYSGNRRHVNSGISGTNHPHRQASAIPLQQSTPANPIEVPSSQYNRTEPNSDNRNIPNSSAAGFSWLDLPGEWYFANQNLHSSRRAGDNSSSTYLHPDSLLTNQQTPSPAATPYSDYLDPTVNNSRLNYYTQDLNTFSAYPAVPTNSVEAPLPTAFTAQAAFQGISWGRPVSQPEHDSTKSGSQF